MDFLLIWDYKSNQALQLTESQKLESTRQLILQDDSRARIVDNLESTLVWLGDLVLPEGYASEARFFHDLGKDFDPKKVLTAGGHFYCLFYQKQKQELHVLTGFAGILPVYYTLTSREVFISSTPERILQASGLKPQISSRFLVEKILFNYPLFQHTLFRDIWLLPCHHMMQLTNTLHVKRYFNPESLLNKEPESIGASLSELSRVFRTRLHRYWPGTNFAMSFTGGFDGRTLLSCALNDNREFITYSFGASDSRDLTLPGQQAGKLNVTFSPFYLDDQEYIGNSLLYGQEFVERSAGMADMARAHYVYGVKKLAQNTSYLVTGNFGSELFRAMHLTGEMIAYPTYLIFALNKPGKVIEEIKKSDAYKALNPLIFEEVEEGLMHDLNTFYEGKWGHLSLNKRFYMFVLEEVFRKYFGPEITMQSKYLINRTPFLDFQFVEELFSSQLAGIYNDFYQHNPVKRKRGQLLYARIIKDTHRQLYRMKTGKGYAPRDVLHPLGNLKLAGNLIKKKLISPTDANDPFCVKKAFVHNLENLRNIPVNQNHFDLNYLNNLVNQKPDSYYKILLKTWSINWYISKVTEKWNIININSSS
jgi:hypothetical protein